MTQSLPIWEVQSGILAALQKSHKLVLVAPTGSGKSTQVPQMLLDNGLVGDKQIVILQPRRLAARTLAARVAYERSCVLGGQVGYQIRFDDRTSKESRIVFVTEGILLRWLQDEPDLPWVGAILFDEFHERNLMSDVALGLVKQMQERSRPDLHMVVMSATIEAEPVADYLDAPIVVSEGQMFPVEVRHLPHLDEREAFEKAADSLEDCLASGEAGDVLIFMPGMFEINRTIEECRSRNIAEPLAFIPLHGDLSPDEQDRAFSPNERRKVVVATNVAETSVTIDGIRIVIDSGLARVARFDHERGIGTLMIERISRASADQRKGRAGRTAPGICLRMWTRFEEEKLPSKNTPEIQRSDLAEVVLLLYSLHVGSARDFPWLDKPATEAIAAAEALLLDLGALTKRADGHLEITPVGKRMLRLPMHPRYSRLLIEAADRGCLGQAALCAALVSGRDMLMRLGRDDKHISQAREAFEGSDQSDFDRLMRAYQFAKANSFNPDRCRRYGIHAQTAKQVDQTFQQIVAIAKHEFGERMEERAETIEPLAKSLLTAFGDQVCMRKNEGTLDCDISNGTTGVLVRDSMVQKSKYFVASSIKEVQDRSGEPMVLLNLATAINPEWLAEFFPQFMRTTVQHVYDKVHRRVAAVQFTYYKSLVIKAQHLAQVDATQSGRTIADAFLQGEQELPLLNHEVKQLISRAALVAALNTELELPSFTRDALRECLTEAFKGITLVKEAQKIELRSHFENFLGPDTLDFINELAPIVLPWLGDKKLKLTYPENPLDEDGVPASPEAQVKLHECFPLTTHPTICEGKLPVKLWLTTPDGKRLESTFNWPAFRANTYPKLRGTLQKKFPGNIWL